jgi:aldehyde:ferredoxin oxidoreductase
MRAAQSIGGEAPQFAVHTARGNTPLGHDHRPSWMMMFDIVVANTGSYELHVAPMAHIYGIKEAHADNPEDVAEFVSRTKWLTQYFDSLGICRLANKEFVELLDDLLNASTGWDFDRAEAEQVGTRALNLMRAFNLRHGFDTEAERPSPRYGSIPTDGPHEGRNIAPLWDGMLDIYYRNLGWDRATGKPLPETLAALGLEHVSEELWGK